MAAPRHSNKNSKSGKDDTAAAAAVAPPPTRITAITLVPNEQNITFTGFESGLIHRNRRNSGPDDAPAVVLSGHTAPVTGLSAPATPDEVTSCSLDGTLRIWVSTVQPPGEPGVATNNNSKRCIRTVQVGAPIRCMLASPAGGDTYYCGTTNGTVVRVEGGKVVEEFTGAHTEAVTAIAMAESGAMLTASLDGTIVGWDLSTRNPVYVFKGHSGHVRGAAVSGSNLLTVGSDETLLCFAVPADFTPPASLDETSASAGAGGGAAAGDAGGDYYADDQQGGGDNNENDNTHNAAHNDTVAGTGGSTANNTWPKFNWIIKPSAKVQLPWLPTSITVVGNYAVLGTSARIVASVNIRQLSNKVTEYTQRIETSLRQAERKLKKLAFEKKKAVRVAARRAIRQFKAEHGGGGGDEEGGGDDTDDVEYDEDGNPISSGGNGGGGGGADNAYAIEEFEREQQQQMQDKSLDIDSDVAAQVARFGRLRNQYFVQSAQQFITSAMCDIVPGTCRDSVLGVAGELSKVYAASGTVVETLTLRPRVRAV